MTTSGRHFVASSKEKQARRARRRRRAIRPKETWTCSSKQKPDSRRPARFDKAVTMSFEDGLMGHFNDVTWFCILDRSNNAFVVRRLGVLLLRRVRLMYAATAGVDRSIDQLTGLSIEPPRSEFRFSMAEPLAGRFELPKKELSLALSLTFRAPVPLTRRKTAAAFAAALRCGLALSGCGLQNPRARRLGERGQSQLLPRSRRSRPRRLACHSPHPSSIRPFVSL